MAIAWGKHRLYDNIVHSGGCWLWSGRTNNYGYGVIRVKGKNVYTHRLSWELRNGRKIPSGLMVRHSCDNRTCIHPDHLSLGTHQDNMKDMADKGKRTNHKLSETQVRRLVKLRDDGVPVDKYAKELGIGVTYARRVAAKKAWRHLW
jgi:hypothetical protein